MIEIAIFKRAGQFAENKDVARDIRLKEITPALRKNDAVVLNFENVDVATQSFIHALISSVIQEFGRAVLDRIEFKSCNNDIRRMIEVVTTYVQDSLKE